MKNHRISTTISQKHWEILKENVEIFETQQKVIELALESLENGSKQSPALPPEEDYLIRIKQAKTLCIIERNLFKLLMETGDTEQLQKFFISDKPMEYAIEYTLQKSLKECSLKEVIDGLVMVFGNTGWIDTVDYIDDGNYFTLKVTQGIGSTASKLTAISIENALKTYGVKTESIISPKIIFMKIFKN